MDTTSKMFRKLIHDLCESKFAKRIEFGDIQIDEVELPSSRLLVTKDLTNGWVIASLGREHITYKEEH